MVPGALHAGRRSLRWNVTPTLAGAVALVLLASSLLLVPASAGSPGGAPSGLGSGILPATAFPSVGTESSVPATGSTTPLPIPNVLVVSPCETGRNAEVQQAYDPAHNVLYEAWIGCGPGIGFSRSLDGGATFQPAIDVLGSVTSSPGSYSWDPAIAIAPNGTVYVAFQHRDTTAPGFNETLVAWSNDQGVSFQGDAFISPPSSTAFYDRVFLASAPNGTLYATWNQAPNGSLVRYLCPPGESCYYTAGDFNSVFASSADGGVSWSAPRALTPNYPIGGGIAAPLLVAPDGAIDVLVEDLSVTNTTTDSVGPAHLYLTRSTDGGVSWETPVLLPGPGEPSTYSWIDAAVTIDPAGTLYAGFDAPAGDGHDHRYIASSSNAGANWTLYDLGAPLNHSAAAQEMVTPVAVAPGVIDIAWMSNNSEGGVPPAWGYWGTYLEQFSLASGSTSPPLRVSNHVGLPCCWVGDTIGVTYLGSARVAVSWSYLPEMAGACGGSGLCPNSEVWAAVTAPFPEYAVTLREHHLPVGVTWSIGAPGVRATNTTVPVPRSLASQGEIVLPLPNGTFNFSLTPPAGYGVAKIVGPNDPNQTGLLVTGAGAVLKVKFGPLEPVVFYQNQTAHHGKLHMYAGAPWQVFVNTSLAHGGDPSIHLLSGTGPTLGPVYLPHGGYYAFQVVGFPSIYKAHPSHGKFGVPVHEKDKKVAFKLLAAPVKFKETGLTAPFAWNVTLVNASGAGAAWLAADCGGFGCTFAKTNGSAIKARLPAGTYGWAVQTSVAGKTATPASGTVTVVYPYSSTISIPITWV